MKATGEPTRSIVRHANVTPDFLAIGHVTRDLLPDGSWRLGGTVTFAALTASRLGLRAAIVTSAPLDLVEALDAILPDIPLSVVPSNEATTFENIYSTAGRKQYLRSRAELLTLAAIPPTWANAPIALLAPVAQEVDGSLVTAFPGALVAATPQGWLRQWDTHGLVTPDLQAAPSSLIPRLQAIILSREDFVSSQASGDERQRQFSQAKKILRQWSYLVPAVVETRGAEGAYLWRKNGQPEMFTGYPAHEVDPTGAGDVFAAAFLCELHATGDAARAVDFANRVAACSVEAPGGEGIPTREILATRWNT